MSRAERRAREQADSAAPPLWGEVPLQGLGVALVPGSPTRWFAYRCGTDGKVELLTPLHDGKLRGEGKPNAVGRLKVALIRSLGGLDVA